MVQLFIALYTLGNSATFYFIYIVTFRNSHYILSQYFSMYREICSMVSSKYYCILVGIIFIYIYIYIHFRVCCELIVFFLLMNNNNEVVLYMVNKTNFGLKLCGLPKKIQINYYYYSMPKNKMLIHSVK